MKLEISGEPCSSSSSQPALGGAAGPVRAAGGCCKALLQDLHATHLSEGVIMVAD